MSVTQDNAMVLLLSVAASVLLSQFMPLSWSHTRKESISIVVGVAVGISWAVFWAFAVSAWDTQTFTVALVKDVLLAIGTMQMFYRAVWEWLGLERICRDYKALRASRRKPKVNDGRRAILPNVLQEGS